MIKKAKKMQRKRFLSGDWTVFKITREQKRNKYADEVCREVRYVLGSTNIDNYDFNILHKYLLKWMRYAKKSKYIRP